MGFTCCAFLGVRHVDAPILDRQAWNTAGQLTRQTNALGGVSIYTVTYPDASSQVSAYSFGRLTSVTRQDSGGDPVSQTTYQYDPHGRTGQVTDARNGATTYTYNNADQVVTVTTPPPGNGEPGQLTTTFYDTSGRTTGYLHPDGTTSTNLYFPTGLLQMTWGVRAYPVEYTYDAQGRMRTMKTWQDFAGNGGAATTRWNYHPQRGWLASKDYPDAATGNPPGTEGTGGPVYTNTPAGRLQTRVWKRGVTTAYAYNSAGSLTNVSYTGGTVTNYATTYTYDRRGRRKTAVRNSITTTWTYNDADQPLTETHSGGTLASLSMTWTYDNALRRDVLTAKNGTNILQAADYNYDTAGRLQTVLDGSVSATYAYHPNSTLIATVALTNGPGTGSGLGVSRAYDKLNRLLNITSRAYGSAATNLPVSFDYLYNRANQRTRATLGDGTCWVYLYDNLGQVISGRRYWQDGTEVLGQQFEYRFDDIGNRDTTGGRVSSVSDYTANRLNQYSTRTVPPYVEVMGVANPTTNVTVNGNVAGRKGEYFHHALSVTNASALYPTIMVTSQYGSKQSRTGEVFVAASPEVYGYDADGNLTSDGRWTYAWDGENRLVEMKRDTSSPTLSSRLRLVFEYDHLGRRIRKYYYTHSGSAWVEQRDTICLYDGWNVVAELDANASKARLRTYVWGSDLSGTVEGAGGVGGLLWLNNYQTTYDGQTLPTGVHFVAYDGNGNVAALTKASDGSVSARYEHGPFGEPVRQTGALADAQPFRFSTKWTDAETGLLYYGYRYYQPLMGRWLSRDPINETGSAASLGRVVRLNRNEESNLYRFVSNDPAHLIDRLGLAAVTYSQCYHLIGDGMPDTGRRLMEGAEAIHKLDPQCPGAPRIMCRCDGVCQDSSKPSGVYNQTGNTVTLCYRNLPNETELTRTLIHELTHIYVKCTHPHAAGPSCSGCIQSELAAYSTDGTCDSRADKEVCIKEHAVYSCTQNRNCGNVMQASQEADKWYPLYGKPYP